MRIENAIYAALKVRFWHLGDFETARETSNKTNQVKRPATAIATRAVTGRSNPVWAAESVMTPVIVPGLAAKRTNGVNDAPESTEHCTASMRLLDRSAWRSPSMPVHRRPPP